VVSCPFVDLEYIDLFLEEIKMVRTLLLSACAVLLAFCITSYSYAELIDNGDGTITQIRSDGTKLMWTQDTLLAGDSGLPESKKNWNEAKTWAANLDFAGYSDWRLPRTPGTITNGITTEGELGDLYHSELGDLKNPDKFKMSDNHNNVFWTETELDATSVFIVNYGNFKGKYKYSYQQTCSAEDNRQAWAVRDVTDSVDGVGKTAAAEVTEDVVAATDTKVEEVTIDAETKANAETITETEDSETTEVIADAEIVADANVTTETKTTESIEVTETVKIAAVKESQPVTNDAEKAEPATDKESVTEAVSDKEEIAADIIAMEAAAVAVTAKVEVVTKKTVTTEAESQDVQEHTRAKGEREEGRITLHILNEKDIKSIYNGECIKIFWTEESEKNAEIDLCLYGINNYRFEDNNFRVSFTKGSSIKCSEVVVNIPFSVISEEQIHTIFDIEKS
jgi:hypothetical protein